MDLDALLPKLVSATLSDPREGDVRRVRVRPVTVKGRRHYQFEETRGAKAFHRNLEAEAAAGELRGLLKVFRQGRFKCEDADVELVDGRPRARPAERPPADARHDREKAHLIPEGEPVPFLVELGVMTADGRVRAAARDKFRQLNRYLEFVDDVLPELPPNPKVVDLGCGKSYLTFGLERLMRARGMSPDILGVDLKADVVESCRGLAATLGLGGLRFEAGDIATFKGVEKADLVVSLHACDTATDVALARAMEWGAKVILAAPCCQHELAPKIRSELHGPLLRHGILKERLAALLTDALRAELLETAGYETRVIEFVDSEHTPKNLLIRAVRRGRRRGREAYRALRDAWGAGPSLERLLPE